MPTPTVHPQTRKLLGTKQGQELLRQAGKGEKLSESSQQVIDPAMAQQLLAMLETVTGPGGTATRVGIARDPNPPAVDARMAGGTEGEEVVRGVHPALAAVLEVMAVAAVQQARGLRVRLAATQAAGPAIPLVHRCVDLPPVRLLGVLAGLLGGKAGLALGQLEDRLVAVVDGHR